MFELYWFDMLYFCHNLIGLFHCNVILGKNLKNTGFMDKFNCLKFVSYK